MAEDVKKPQMISYLSFVARGLLVLAGAFILKAYFFKIPRMLYFTNSDTLMHFTGFFILGLMLAVAFPKCKISLSLCVILLFGILLEIAQPVITAHRELSLADMMANASGGFIGYGVGVVIIYIAVRLSQ